MSVHSLRLWAQLFSVLLLASTSASAQFGDEEDDEYRGGLVATISASGRTVQRIDQTIAFRWAAGESLDPRVSGERYEAAWRGLLQSQSPGDYHFHLYVAGDVEIRFGGRVVLDKQCDSAQWVTSQTIKGVEYGLHPIEVIYQPTRASGELRIFWSGPDFGLEPISARRLFHKPASPQSAKSIDGQSWVDALRCAACHHDAAVVAPEPAPSLRYIRGQLNSDWAVKWLMAAADKPKTEPAETLSRRMPYFEISEEEAVAINAFLLHQASRPSEPPDVGEQKTAAKTVKKTPKKKKTKKKKPETPNSDRGRELFLTTGCLACHTLDEVGEDNLYGGSDLTFVANKRPASFYEAWLKAPALLNPDHRMPTFDLSSDELGHLSSFLSERQAADQRSKALSERVRASAENAEQVALGKRLAAKHRCAACHDVEGLAKPEAVSLKTLTDATSQGCAGGPSSDANSDRPSYALPERLMSGTTAFVQQMLNSPSKTISVSSGALMMKRRNCASCHQREDAPGLARRLSRTIDDFPELATQTPAMTPPSLISVGDKLNDEALAESITRSDEVRRPWLLVRMPKFRLDRAGAARLADHLIVADRIPDGKHSWKPVVERDSHKVAGPRLVTPDGFGCTSCHQIGNVKPPKAPLNAMGPNLSQLGKRIRYSWYQRWVRNPARIVPRMEMPSVQIPVSGALNDDLDQQLEAVWSVLNDPSFRPPEPNAIRIVRKQGRDSAGERAAVLTDVLNVGQQQYIKPLLVGLPNRHNVMFDLQTGRLSAWWIGDVARQRTKGKTWYWEPGGADMLGGPVEHELSIRVGDNAFTPVVNGQFVTELDRWEHRQGGIVSEHRVRFANGDKTHVVRMKQRWEPLWPEGANKAGWKRTILFRDLPGRAEVLVRMLGDETLAGADRAANVISWTAGPGGSKQIKSVSYMDSQGRASTRAGSDGSAGMVIEYRAGVSVDRFPPTAAFPNLEEPLVLDSAPGFEAIRLPISGDIMPTSLAWRPNGEIVVTSLKGRVWIAADSDGDGLEDRLSQFSDELAAPFGAYATNEYIDVVNKFGLLRLRDGDGDGHAESVERLASGWGHTADYHDWAIGLPSDGKGGYWVATACQQDKRSKAGAKLRGAVLELTPREPTAQNPDRFTITTLSDGHRFPIGIARNRAGQIFVSDNQGNFNPFNELNHVVAGRSYGFINAIDRRADFVAPPLTLPAVNIPHPWTRSVNGLCFLETPEAVRAKRGSVFGPFEGHLVGAEYDTRRLVRMSLQEVDGWVQGAVYPLSHYHPRGGATFLGPLICSVSPAGDLYVGSIRDSGWGGSNNIGTLVRMRPKMETLPPGIAEVVAIVDGFQIQFTSPVDQDRGADPANYSLASYTRTSTPAYGGSDEQRRKEKVASVELADDRRSATVRLADIRAGFVYEIRVRNLVDGAKLFHPAEAFYSMTKVPKE